MVYAGDKDNVNEALKVMFYKAMKMPILKDLPKKFFWKSLKTLIYQHFLHF